MTTTLHVVGGSTYKPDLIGSLSIDHFVVLILVSFAIKLSSFFPGHGTILSRFFLVGLPILNPFIPRGRLWGRFLLVLRRGRRCETCGGGGGDDDILVRLSWFFST